MAANFAALEDRTAQAVHGHLFNAQAVAAGGAVFDVAFDDAFTAALGIEASAPQALALSHQVQALSYQSVVLITRKGAPSGESFQVVNKEPDGTGITRLILERAP